MNTCYRCGDSYKPYTKKLKRYGVMSNGIIFGVIFDKRIGPNHDKVKFFRRKDKFIPMCEKCLNETINFIEVFNDNKRDALKYAKRDEKEVQAAYERIFG